MKRDIFGTFMNNEHRQTMCTQIGRTECNKFRSSLHGPGGKVIANKQITALTAR